MSITSSKTINGMTAEAMWHLACVLMNIIDEEGTSADDIDHLMQAMHALSLSYLRDRQIL